MAAVRRFLGEFGQLPIEKLSEADAGAALQKLKDELRSCTNPLITAICAEAALRSE